MSNCHKDHVTLQLLLNSSWSAAASHQNREFVRKIYDGWCVTWEQVLGRVGAAREWDRATASAGWWLRNDFYGRGSEGILWKKKVKFW